MGTLINSCFPARGIKVSGSNVPDVLCHTVAFELDQVTTTSFSSLCFSSLASASLPSSFFLCSSPFIFERLHIICSLIEPNPPTPPHPFRPPTSDGGLHFSRGETHPGGCCQDGCISEADCCEAAATTDSSLLGFVSVGGGFVCVCVCGCWSVAELRRSSK